MNRILIYYTVSAILLCWLSYLEHNKTSISSTSNSAFYQWIEPKLESNFDQKSKGVLLLKLVTGHGPTLHHTVKKPFEDLYLYSLITFNGLHLFLILEVFNLNKKKKFKKLVTAFALFASFSPTIFKKNLYYLNFLKKINSLYLFYFSQLIIGILSYLFQKEFSFIFCFIFTGFYFFMRSIPRSQQIWNLTIIQLMIALALNKSFSIFGLFFSIILIRIFIKFYAGFFVIFFISLLGKFKWINFLINFNFSIITKLAVFSNSFKIEACLFLLLTMLICQITKSKWPWIIFAIFNAGIAFTPVIHYSR
jgi:hypothetical protein